MLASSLKLLSLSVVYSITEILNDSNSVVYDISTPVPSVSEFPHQSHSALDGEPDTCTQLSWILPAIQCALHNLFSDITVDITFIFHLRHSQS